MTEAQIQLQNALTTTFLANLVFLSEYDNELYQRVDELSRMIEQGTYQEKYALEFLMESGEFDIYDIVNDKYLYDKKPKKINNELVRSVNLDKKYSILDLPNYFTKKQKFDIDMEKRFDLTTRDELVKVTANDVYEYVEALSDNLNSKKKSIKKIEKFIFLGTLLGRHIPRIAQKIDAKMYLVLERNLEIFRLSLFTVDYTILAKNGVIFSIMDDYIQESNKITRFLSTSLFDNYLLKFSSSKINIETYIDIILSTISSLNPEAYDYNRRLYMFVNRGTKYLNKYKIPMFKNIQNSCDIFKDIPILYIAAGPSLGENIDWIKENQNKFFIVTVGSAIKKLLDNNIRIDMITSVDELDEFDITQFSDENVSKIDSKTITLMSILTYEKVLKKLNQENLFLFEVFTPFHNQNKSFSGFSIGEITLGILLNLNPKEIYLVGLDLALNQKTGESHTEGSNSWTLKVNLEEEQSRDTFSHKTSLIKVKGNLKKEVLTNPSFYSSIKDIDAKLDNKPSTLEVYNLSTHGAYFKNTIPKKSEDINLKDLKNIYDIKDSFYKFLGENSEISLDKESLEYLQKEFDFVNDEVKLFLKEIQSKNFKNYDELLDEIFSILRKTIEDKHVLFYQLIFEYCALIIPYISYHFNDMEIKNENKKLKKVTTIFANQLNRICEDYITCLKRIL